MEPPVDPRIGFLPPNHDPPQGEGSVLFSVRTMPGLVHGSSIAVSAEIVFDANPPIATGAWVNHFDITPPVSWVEPLPATVEPGPLEIVWGGEDDGAGIDGYTLWMWIDGLEPVVLAADTVTTATTVQVEEGHTYGFAVMARDAVGHREPEKLEAEAQTLVVVPPKPDASVTFDAGSSPDAGGADDAGVVPPGGEEGCSCTTERPRGGLWMGLYLALALWVGARMRTLRAGGQPRPLVLPSSNGCKGR